LLWVRTGIGAKEDYAFGIAAHGDGAVIVGYFTGAIDFGPHHLASNGAKDIFVVKYDAAGEAIWARSAGGAGSDFGSAVAVGTDGTVVVVGSFEGVASFDANTTLQAAGDYDIFIAKYDGSGRLVDAKRVGGAGNDQGRAVQVASDGSVLVAANFTKTTELAAGASFTAVGSTDVFVAKYDGTGNLLWAITEGGAGTDALTGLALAADGSFAIGGYFFGSIIFGEPPATQSLTVATSNDPFVASYDRLGHLVWVKQIHSSGVDFTSGVAKDAAGNVILAGAVAGTVDFAPGVSFATSPATETDAFLAKYSTTGNLVWVRRAEGPATDEGTGVALANDGTILWTGTYFNTLSLGSSTRFPEQALSTDVFVAREDPSGNLLWAARYGGSSLDASRGVAVLADGSIAIVGSVAAGSSVDDFDVFLARFSP
jgi:hypothetical protein